MSSQPNNLRINYEERRFLGVCAGIADYLDIPVALVRIVFVISVLTWPTLILAYFALYFWLDKDLNSGKVYDWLNGSAPSQHFKNLDYRRPLYRNMRNRKIAGVCSGIADYLEVKPILVRGAAVLAFFILGPYALLGYGICWLVMKPNPAPRRVKRQRRYYRRKCRSDRRKSRHGLSSSRINQPEDESDAFYRDADYDSLYEPQQEPVTARVNAAASEAKKTAPSSSRQSYNEKSVEECADVYYALESRLRDLEAFVTSKKFRLHCEIKRI